MNGHPGHDGPRIRNEAFSNLSRFQQLADADTTLCRAGGIERGPNRAGHIDDPELAKEDESKMDMRAFATVNTVDETCDAQGSIPDYVMNHYWWAYVHPNGVRIFERQWLVDAILFGNYRALSTRAVEAIEPGPHRTLQVSCAYGSITPQLHDSIGRDGFLDVIDVAPIQLKNLSRKLPKAGNYRLQQQDSTRLGFDDHRFRNVMLFFLLHEQPDGVREQTVAEALRVCEPGGRIIIADYHRPDRWNPMRLFKPVFAKLEPFSIGLWGQELAGLFPVDAPVVQEGKSTVFGGLYQVVVFRKTG